ncbi:hypothetical protein OHA72_40510 [Dactylosporangium sp. NBC_01737]|nr:hypothetical protein OHA72_40510 [Dactylosporangium sp. NBC_01737]
MAGFIAGDTGTADTGRCCCCCGGGGVTVRGIPDARTGADGAPMHSAPSTTTVSGCSRVVGATPSSVWIRCAARGIRDDPPTRKIPTRSFGCNLADSIARRRHDTVRSR